MHTRALPVAALAVLLAPAAVHAATGPASLACSAPARPTGEGAHEALTLKGLIPATDAALNLTLTHGAHQLTMLADSGDTVRVVESWADRVFTLVVDRKAGGPELKLHARPSTVKVKKEAHGVYARFQAVLQLAPRPGPSGAPAAVLRAVILSCQYDYEV